MSKILTLSLAATLFATCLYAGTDSTSACRLGDDFYFEPIKNKNDELPVIEIDEDKSDSNWMYLPNVAQYKRGNWDTCIGIAHNTTRRMAKLHAENNPNITFFFYVKGYQMILENTEKFPATFRMFQKGDAVFFEGDPAEFAEWGTAPGLADGYIKQ